MFVREFLIIIKVYFQACRQFKMECIQFIENVHFICGYNVQQRYMSSNNVGAILLEFTR